MNDSNGTSGNHSMTSSLKEMLKINSSTLIAGQDNVSGAGDGVNENATTSRTESDVVSLEAVTSLPDTKNLFQTISLNSVEDGTSVPLTGYETRIIANIDTEIDHLPTASNKIQFKTVTKFEWDHQYYLGNLISVTDKLTAYCVKGRGNSSVRVINRQNASDRVLLKGFSGSITDLSFSHSRSNLLAAVDEDGNLIVWSVVKIGGKLNYEVKLHIEGENVVEKESVPRLVWIPSHQYDPKDSEDTSKESESKSDPSDFGMTEIMALFNSNTVEVWYMKFAFELTERYTSTKLTRSQLERAFLAIHNPDSEITDCELSPFGNVLAAASADGFVKFWQVDQQQTPECLHKWQPHDGRPVSAVRFCDELNQAEPRVYWRFLLTGCDRNLELKMWCAVSWKCLQVIHFQASSPEYQIPEMNLTLSRSANFLALSDIHRKVLYVMRVKADLKKETACVSELAYYPLTFPILSQAFISVEDCKFNSNSNGSDKETEPIDYFSDPDETKSQEGDSRYLNEESDGLLVKLLAIQRRSLQSLDIPFIPAESEANSLSESLNNSGIAAVPPAIQASTASLLGAGDSVVSVKSSLSKELSEKAEKPSNPTPEKQYSTPSQIPANPESVLSNKSEAKDDLPSTSSPVLLTPDAFMTSGKSSEKEDESASASLLNSMNSLNDIFTEPISKDPIAKLFDVDGGEKSFTSQNLTKTPPSSPVVPVSTPISTVQTSSAVVELLQSYQSSSMRSTIKSPDLISSAATSDDVKHDPIVPPAIGAPPGIPSRPLNSASPFSAIDSPNVFNSLLASASSNPAAWPKAPDVTMSHLLPASSSTPTSINLSSVVTGNLISVDTSISPQGVEPGNITDAFSEFRKQQERLLKEHKQKMDVMANKQKQFQKQCETMWKKAEQHGDRVEKAVTSLGQNQLQLSNDIKIGQSSLSESMTSKIDRSVKSEMKRVVLPGVTSSIDEIRDKLSSSVAQQLSATDSVLRETVTKSLKSKDMVEKVSNEMSKLLQDRIQSILPDIFLRTLIPAFEKICQVMFQQLSSTYQKGMDEMTKQLEKQMQFRLKTEYDKLNQATKEALDTARQIQAASKQLQGDIKSNVNKQFQQNMDLTLKKFEEKIISRMVLNMKQQQEQSFQAQCRLVQESVEHVVSRVLDEKLTSSTTNDAPATSLSSVQLGAPPLLHQSSVINQQEQILKFLQKGNVNQAFQNALNASNLDLVMYVCETANPSLIFNVSPCPLEQPILLSLIQQLSSELSTKTDLKLRYLQEAVMNLDRNHQVTKEYMPRVLGTLVQSINSVASVPGQALPKQLKMLGMAAQSLMG